MIQRNKRAISNSSTRGVVDKEVNSESGGWWFKSAPGREKQRKENKYGDSCWIGVKGVID